MARSTDRKSTRLNSRYTVTTYAVFCLKKKTTTPTRHRRDCPRAATAPTSAAYWLAVPLNITTTHSVSPVFVLSDLFFYINPAPSTISTLSLHDALQISLEPQHGVVVHRRPSAVARHDDVPGGNEVSDHGALY